MGRTLVHLVTLFSYFRSWSGDQQQHGIKADEKNAKKEFEKSAKEVIEKLKSIEKELV